MQTLSLGFFCFWMVFDFKEVLDTFQLVTFEDQLDQLKPPRPIKQLHAGFKYFFMKTFYCTAHVVGCYQKLVCGARCLYHLLDCSVLDGESGDFTQHFVYLHN